ncbi:hypothetical protein A6V36_09820 [Paraburkholderia ginsengiterrae]|uniref:Uncharacterized protein n=1 Tax=Paraburkholderia ginsengiterrae TaxID=1462993 RepID=A0A1A9NHL4_9BURK|nr:hypothetical protein [Paraburkholderia ginsengiterrae]OAJ53753.1 hypothetical protein A6V36_09820 [Paraburkholderia ginsengiterrae]OAJ65880.1 hypothetical protein A6V37_13020 [Paraburkholderia ginsengiterrae]
MLTLEVVQIDRPSGVCVEPMRDRARVVNVETGRVHGERVGFCAHYCPLPIYYNGPSRRRTV